MLGLDKLIQAHKWLQLIVKGYLILFQTINTSLKPISESPCKMVLKTHCQLTMSVLKAIFSRNSFMADVQISQSGPLFPKISLLDAKCCDFA